MENSSSFSSLRFSLIFPILIAAMLCGVKVTSSVTDGIEATFTPSMTPPPPHDLQEHSFFSHTTSLPPILSHLGFHELATAAPSLSEAAPTASSAWNGPSTIFAPSDASLRTCFSCSVPNLLREHTVPDLFTIEYLRRLAFGTKIETLSPGRCITVTSDSVHPNISTGVAPKIFIGGVEITQPDLFNNGMIVVHGLQGFITNFTCHVERMTSLSFPFHPDHRSNPHVHTPGTGATVLPATICVCLILLTILVVITFKWRMKDVDDDNTPFVENRIGIGRYRWILEGKLWPYGDQRTVVKRYSCNQIKLANIEFNVLSVANGCRNVVSMYGFKNSKDRGPTITLELCGCNLRELIDYYKNNTIPHNCSTKEFLVKAQINFPVLWTNLFLCDGMTQIMIDIVEAVRQLHEKRIKHSDLNISNVLIVLEKKKLRGRLCDFEAGEFVPHGRENELCQDMVDVGHIFRECFSLTLGYHYDLSSNMPEAHELVNGLIGGAIIRPKNALLHPALWKTDKKLSLLVAANNKIQEAKAGSAPWLALDKQGQMIFSGPDWFIHLDTGLQGHITSQIAKKRARYNRGSAVSLLRLIRNSHAHATEVEPLIGDLPMAFYYYFAERFPRLLMAVYAVVLTNWRQDIHFARFF